MATNNSLSRFSNNIASISPRNEKLGDIKSISLPAVKTCNPSAPCFKYCYARKLKLSRSWSVYSVITFPEIFRTKIIFGE